MGNLCLLSYWKPGVFWIILVFIYKHICEANHYVRFVSMVILKKSILRYTVFNPYCILPLNFWPTFHGLKTIFYFIFHKFRILSILGLNSIFLSKSGEQRLLRSIITPGLGNSGYAQLGAGINWNFRQGLFTVPEQLAFKI